MLSMECPWSVVVCVALFGTACGVDRARYNELQAKTTALEAKVRALESEKRALLAEISALRETPEGAWNELVKLREARQWTAIDRSTERFLGRWPSSSLATDVRRVRAEARQRAATDLFQLAQEEIRQGKATAEATLNTLVRDYTDTALAAQAKSELTQLERKLALAKAAAEREEEQRLAERERANAQLELRSFSWSQEHGYAIVEGIVNNISGASIDTVQAVAIFNDASGGFITSDTALTEYQPLLPNQSSPFKVMARWNPAMKTCRVEFKRIGGREIPTYHSWRRKKR